VAQRASEGKVSTVLPTTLVGSYPQPDWLIDRAKLAGRFPPRVRAKELWRVAPEWLEQAQDDATILAIRDQERAGLDIITDGEMRRESYSNRFATALEGVDIDNPGTALDRSGHPNPVPRVVGRIQRRHPVQVRDVSFLRANTDRMIKTTVPGAFTMAQQAQNDFYKDEVELAMDYAAAINEEISDLFAAGADVVQIDEPYMQARPAKAKQFGVEVLNRSLKGITGTTAVHLCFGYAAIIHQRPAGYSVPTGTRSCRCAANFDRNCTIAPRLRCARGASVEDRPSRRFRSVGYDCGNAGDCCRPHSARVTVCRCKQDRRSARLRPEVFAA
jgi:5-methyltetrahydropteroyltriglutamate--homocysteine methyltransferase